MALILQLIIIWLVGILFESGVDDGRTYRQVAGSWVCSWWVTTVVNKGSATLETGRLDTKSFQYELKQWNYTKLSSSFSKRVCMETTDNPLFFLRQVSFVFPGFFWGTNNHEITSKQWPCEGWLRYNCMIFQVYFSKTCSLPYHHA